MGHSRTSSSISASKSESHTSGVQQVNSHSKLFCGTWQLLDTAGGQGRELTSTPRRVYCKRCQSLPLFCFGYQGTSSPPLLLPVRSAAWHGALFLRWLHTSSLTQLLWGEAELHLPKKPSLLTRLLAWSTLVPNQRTRMATAMVSGARDAATLVRDLGFAEEDAHQGNICSSFGPWPRPWLAACVHLSQVQVRTKSFPVRARPCEPRNCHWDGCWIQAKVGAAHLVPQRCELPVIKPSPVPGSPQGCTYG